MSLSTSSSDTASEAQPYRLYLLIFFGLIVIGLIAIEAKLRLGEQSRVQAYLHRVFNETTDKIQIGDSHAGGNLSVLPDYAFIGQGGLSPVEIEHVVKYYFRYRNEGRAIIVLGPNSLARNRQLGTRALPKNTLAYQFLPFPIYLLEPAFRDGLQEKLLSGFGISASAGEMTRDEAKDLWEKTRSENPDTFNIGMLSYEAQFLLADGRFPNQNPVEDFRASAAFQAAERTIAWLARKGIDACIVDTPLSPVYREIIAQNADTSRFGEAQAAFADMAQRHGFRFASGPILAPNWPDELFQDQDHLNPQGHKAWWPMVEEYCFAN